MAQTKTIAIALTALLAPGVLAQGGERLRIDSAAPRSNRKVIDRVMGVFGDKAILESDIQRELAARISGMELEGEQLSPERILSIKQEILVQKLRDEALAQSARSMKGNSRERVDQIVESYLEDRTRQEVEKAGSLNKLTEELGLLGRTMDSVNEARRTELLADLAMQENLRRKWRDGFALAVTPTQVRRFYDENLEQFVPEESADIEVIALRVGADPNAAMVTASEAAQAWRSGKSTDAVASQAGGIVLDVRRGVRNVEDDSNPVEIKEFAASADETEVSDPIPRGNSLWILRVLARTPGRHEQFGDPQVQAYIVDRLVRDKINRENQRLILKNGQKFRPIPARGPIR